MIRHLLSAVAMTVLSLVPASADDGSKGTKVTLVFEQKLPNVPGKSLRGVMVEYEPGGFNAAHTHPKSAFIYATVLEGEIRSQVNEGPERVYRVGENWSENPGDRHNVSANASATKPAKLLAVFVVDNDDKVLVTPIRK
jgi:quercetin dioxygenase-like cupin family protein